MESMDNDVPNIDAMDNDELREFSRLHRCGRKYLKLFPNGGRGTVIAASGLSAYAITKLSAEICRKRGDINGAMIYEKHCDKIYESLPDFARW